MKIGDRVKVISLHSWQFGCVGEITRICPDYFRGDNLLYYVDFGIKGLLPMPFLIVEIRKEGFDVRNKPVNTEDGT